MYNWHAVITNKLCPTGWHVPTDAEWDTLIKFVGGKSVAGGKLKSKTGWFNNGNGTDDYDFTAFPGGIRGSIFENFRSNGNWSYWWTRNNAQSNFAWYWCIDTYSVGRGDFSMDYGLSVRCLKD